MSDSAPHDDGGLAPHDQPGTAPGGNSAARSLARYQVGEAAAGDAERPVRDRSLDRSAIARVAPLAGADDLEQEARFLARLDHLGAPVVLDFVRGDEGAMLITRKMEGITLAEAVDQARAGRMPPELASPVTVVQLMQKICDTVAAVHAQGVVHHAIRPGCIVLGSHGQVVVQDWAAAIAAKRNPATLRYVSSAPAEQILALDGLHQDIQALGACLCWCLLLRGPAADQPDALGLVTPDERRRLPTGLEAIVRQALASGPGAGYASVAQLEQDLLRYSEGQVPAAYVPGPAARLGHWLCANRRPLLAAAAVCVAAGLATGLVWGRQIRDWASWQVVASEDFADPTWGQRWVEPPTMHGMFATRDGRLVSTSERDALLIFRKRLTTPVAIEYSGEILPDSQPCDLSVQWSEDSGIADEPQRFGGEARSYMIQAGAFSNEFCAIYQNPGRRLLAHANRQLVAGKTYRFRVELDGTRITMQIDGETVLEHVDEFPTQSGYLALYAYYKGKAFDDVRVLQRRPGNVAGPLAAADLAFVERRYDAAAALYARASESATDPDAAQQSLYRKGLAEWRGGQNERAQRTWTRIRDPDLTMRIDCTRLESLFRADQTTPHLTGFEEMYQARPEARALLRQSWQRVLQQQIDSPQRNPQVIDYFLGVREKLFPGDESARYIAATTLQALGRYEEVLAKYPEERNTSARVMLAMGRTQQVLDLPWVGRDDRRQALIMRGELAKALDLPGLGPPWRIWAMIRMGRGDVALREELNSAYPILLHLGRAAELLDTTPMNGQATNETLIALGRLQEAAGDGLPAVAGSGSSVTAMLLLGQVDLAERIGKQPRTAIRCMQAAERGDTQTYLALRDQVRLPSDLRIVQGWFAPIFLRPFIDQLRGEAGACEAQLRPRLDLLSGICCRVPWYVASALLGDRPVEELRGMPLVSESTAWQALTTGMRAELLGQRAAAVEGYRAFAALPIHQRLLSGNTPDPDVEWFVAWRLRALQAAR